MSGYLRKNITYDKQALIDLYTNTSEKTIINNYVRKAVLVESDLSNPCISDVLDQLPFVPKSLDSIYLAEILTSSAPHTYEHNNAVIMLPLVETPTITLKTYDFVDLTTPNPIQPIVKSLYVKEEVVIDSPMVVDTSSISSTHITEPVLALVINVPISVSWNSLVETQDWSTIIPTVTQV
jgi:hypothetical protein